MLAITALILALAILLGVAARLHGVAQVWWQDRLARLRAAALVRELLTPAEYAQVSDRGYLEVPSRMRAGRTYRVPATGGPVAVYEGGAPSAYLCLQPAQRLPGLEVVLVHKLLLEADEHEYRRLANVLTKTSEGWKFSPGQLASVAS